LILIVQPACLFRKKAAVPQAPPLSFRIAYLPLNMSVENSPERWLSLAVPVVMAKVGERAPDLEPVPLWEVMPVAVEAAGVSRIITAETAAYVASRLAAKWATEGDITLRKDRVQLTVDFIPTKTTTVPFRYEKLTSIDALDRHFEDAFEQFLRYLVARPMTRDEDQEPMDSTSLKEVATALDREYGWFVTAEPGKSDKVVADLARSDNRLARLLFNPSLYPSIGTPAYPQEGKPAASTSGEGSELSAAPAPKAATAAPSAEARTSTESSGGQAAVPAGGKAPESTPPQGAALPTQSRFVPPPPRSFTQKIDLSGPFARRGSALQNRTAVAYSYTLDRIAGRNGRSGGTETRGSEKALPAAMNKASPHEHIFKIQILALREKQEAESFAGKLTKAGLAAAIEEADLKGKGIWYRVRLGAYDSQDEAEAAAQKLVESGLISQFWIVPPQ
jgi:cell division septation protein DedD